MGLQFAGARAVSAVSTWGLKNVFRRPAANFPGKIALYVDPRLIADLAPKLEQGSVCVVGTNGKTTVTNLLACLGGPTLLEGTDLYSIGPVTTETLRAAGLEPRAQAAEYTIADLVAALVDSQEGELP